MIFSNVRFVDIGASNSGSGSLPSSPLRNLPSYDNFVDDCLYILRKYPQVARTSNIISPTDMTESENDTWVVSQDSMTNAAHGGYRAFDGLANGDFGFVTASGENFPHILSLRNKNEQICVKSYKIRTRYNYSDNGNLNPQEWYLEGSDDGTTWTQLDHRAVSWPSSDYGVKLFNVVGNDTPYYYHRLRFTYGLNGGSQLAIGEVEFYDDISVDTNYYTLPIFGELKGNITNFAFVGCPEEGERFWDVLSNEQRTALENSGWLNSGYKYATIYCSTVNNCNVAINSNCSFYTENIDYLRNPSSENFDSDVNKFMFYFTGGCHIVSIRNCRFSAFGVNLDDERYIEPTPPMKCCAYVRCDCFVDKVVMEGNIINYLPYTTNEERYACDGFAFTGISAGVYITKNKFYMTKSDTTSWISGNNTDDNYPYPRRRCCVYVAGENLSASIFQQTRFFAFNYNELVIRVNSYFNMNSWIWTDRAEKIEFIGNRITQGRDMGTYDQNEMNLCLFKRNLVNIVSTDRSFCTDYYIKDFYVNIPSLWAVYGCHVACFHFLNNETEDYFERTGYNRSDKKNVIDNITIILGEGPDIDDISNDNLSRINKWNEGQGDIALYIGGHITWSGEGYFRYANHANIATNISSYNPWGKALKAYSIYLEANAIRGGIIAGDCTYIKVKNMSIKKARGNSIIIGDTCSGHIEINNLLIEDTSISNYVSFNSKINGSVIVNKTNHPVSNTSSVISGDTNFYNESIILQKDIGDSHAFILKSLNKFIESCNIKHNSNNTLKMVGVYDHDRSLKFIETGESGLSSRYVLPGRYKARINMAFCGDSLYEKTITNPTTDRGNVLKHENLTIGIKTKYGELSTPDIISLDVSNSNSIWDSELVTPFYQEYYIDIYEPQNIFTTIERFNVYGGEVNLSNPTCAVFLDPEIELMKIGDIDYSNSSSVSDSDSISDSNQNNGE